MKYKYINLMNAFYGLHDQEHFTGNEALLYGVLVNLFNSKGRRDIWPETVQLTDGSLENRVGLSWGTLDKARKVLVRRAVIRFKSVGRGKHSGGIYWLIDLPSSSATSSRSSSDFEEADLLSSSNFEEVIEDVTGDAEAEPPQEVPQQPPQQPPQNLRNSIYKVVQTPDARHQTGKEAESKKNADAIGDEMLNDSAMKGTPPCPPVAAAPPSPIIPVYGDGRLHQQVTNFHLNNPGLYPVVMYAEFLRGFTAIVQNDRKYPGFVGKELWEAQDTWTVRTRLEKWYTGYLKDHPDVHNNAHEPATRQNDHNRPGTVVRSATAKAGAKGGNSRPVKRTPVITADQLSRSSPTDRNAGSGSDRHTIVLDVE